MSENDKPVTPGIDTADIRKSIASDGGVNNLYGWVVPRMCDLIDQLRANFAAANAELAKLRSRLPQESESADQLGPAAAFEHAWLLAFKDHINRCRSKEDARFWFLGAIEWQRNQQTAQQWMPIETAPKDGTEIIGWTEDAGRVICNWGKHNHVPLYGWIHRLELYGEEVDGFDPVLWRPLPAPPTLSRDKEG